MPVPYYSASGNVVDDDDDDDGGGDDEVDNCDAKKFQCRKKLLRRGLRPPTEMLLTNLSLSNIQFVNGYNSTQKCGSTVGTVTVDS